MARLPRLGLLVALVALAAAFCTGPARAEKTDIVLLRNGDRITGEVRELERGKLTVKTDDIGTLTIEWDKVVEVRANVPVEVVDLHGARLYGSLEAGPELGTVTIAGPTGSRTVDLDDVVRIRRTGTTFWNAIDGSIDVGLSFTSASSLLTLDIHGAVQFKRPRYELDFDFASSLTRQPEVEDTRRNDLTFSYTRRYEDRWVAFVIGELDQNKALGMNLRASAAGGGGRAVVQSQHQSLLLGVGLNVAHEYPVDAPDDTLVELALPLRYDLFEYDTPKVDIRITFAGFVGLTEWGRLRYEADFNIKREVVRDFTVSLIGWSSYDSDPPSPEAVNLDYGATFALGWTF
jgi:hypothetical protein